MRKAQPHHIMSAAICTTECYNGNHVTKLIVFLQHMFFRTGLDKPAYLRGDTANPDKRRNMCVIISNNSVLE